MSHCTITELNPKIPQHLGGAAGRRALAHDLRSPLNAILLGTEAARLCTRSERPVDLGALLSQIERSARTALELIDSFVLVRPRELARRRQSMARVRLDELASETTEAMQPISERAGVQVKLHVDAAVAVHGDRIRLGRVLWNLLGNAIRHSPKDCPIDVVVARHDSTATCHVADHGPGVPASDHHRIFERHFQGGGAHGAAGLGLFICRDIIEQHGGRIWVEDRLPRGARFVFTIPLERAAPPVPASASA